MKKIWKYEMGFVCSLTMPKGTEFLFVDIQGGIPCAWFYQMNPANRGGFIFMELAMMCRWPKDIWGRFNSHHFFGIYLRTLQVMGVRDEIQKETSSN